jgi:hypothetical protein
MRQTIDGKNDIRVLLSGPSDSEDAGLVEGVPLDPPDDNPGWVLSDLWVEHDTVQEKGEKGQTITRKTNPVFYQVWSRPKTKAKKKRKARTPREPKVAEAKKDPIAAALDAGVTPTPVEFIGAGSKPKRVRKPKKPKKKPRPRSNVNLAQPPEPPPAPTQVEETPPAN